VRERKYVADLVALGAFIYERRRSLGLTQSQLADRVGWVQERISLLEHGKYGMPTMPLLAGLAEALEVDQEALLSAAGFLRSNDESGRNVELERHVQKGRAPRVVGREVMSAGEFSHASVELVSQIERLRVGLETAESQMQEVDSLRVQLAQRRQQLSSLSEELRTALQLHAS
jgi:transcriptional regulator with XRE-family HTH domain